MQSNKYKAGLDGVSFLSNEKRIIGGFYKAGGNTPRPTAILLHGLPGVEKHLDIAYRLRDLGWNCLYFHFRGSWGSSGSFSIDGLSDDTDAAIEWATKQEIVDKNRIVLIAGSTGSYPALVCAAKNHHIQAIVGISPLIEPSAFQFTEGMAESFADMLNGITGKQLIQQWNDMQSLQSYIEKFLPKPMLMITAGKDDIFPPSHYRNAMASFSNIQWITKEESDHGFSTLRPWLVKTVCEWLVAKLGN